MTHFRRETLIGGSGSRSEEHTSELPSHLNLVCRLLLEKNYLYQKYNHAHSVCPHVHVFYKYMLNYGSSSTISPTTSRSVLPLKRSLCITERIRASAF